MAKRGFRGAGRTRFAAGADDELLDDQEPPRLEDSIVVIDAETGNPIDDAPHYAAATDPGPEPTDVGTPGAQGAQDAPAGGAEAAFANLQRSLSDLQRGREDDQRRIQELQARTDAAERGHVQDTVRNAIAQAEGALADAKTRYANAMKNANYADAADAQADITLRANELQRVHAIVHEIEQEEERNARQPAQEQAQPKTQQPRGAVVPTPQDWQQQVDTYIATLSPKQQEFAKQHRATIFPVGEVAPLRRVLALAQVAADDFGADTPEFFQYIEENMTRRPPSDNPAPSPAQQHQPSPPAQRPPTARRPPAAPIGRGAPTAPKQYALTAQQREIAGKMNMTPARYAAYLMTAEEGARDPNYTGPRLSKDDPALSGRR